MTVNQLDKIIERIKYKDWVCSLLVDDAGPQIMWTFLAPDYTNEFDALRAWNSRKYRISKHMTESEVVQTAFLAALQAEEHECREAFSYKGKHPFNPHIALSALLSVCDTLEVRS